MGAHNNTRNLSVLLGIFSPPIISIIRPLFVEIQELDHIIKGCKRNEASAQHQLYKRYYQIFLKICYRYAKDEDEAISMLHDGLLKVYKNIHQFQGKGSFEGWMKRTLVHCCIDFLRGNSKHSHLMDLDAVQESSFLSNTNITSSYDVLEALNVKDLVRLVQQLPEVTKIVFNLYVFEGYSHKEIAQVIGIKEGTSHWHLSKARTLLQAKLALLNPSMAAAYEQK